MRLATYIMLFIGIPLAVNGQVYQYDSVGRLLRVSYPNGAGVSYTYDAAGNLLTQSAVLPSGSYFGSSASGDTNWAMYVRPDNSAVFIAYGGSPATATVVNFTINADETFSSSSSNVSGRISGTQVTGQIGSGNRTFTGTFDNTTGTTQLTAGYYKADALNGAAGSTYIVVGPSGKALAITVTPILADAVSGVVDLNGKITGKSSTGNSAVLTFELPTQSALFELTPPGPNATNYSFGGLADGVISTTKMANISVRAAAGTGSQVLAMGFAIFGSGTKTMLIRGIGPALASFGVTGVLINPQLTVYDSTSKSIASNAGWGGTSALISSFAQVGAFPLSDPSSADAALQLNLGSGTYTAQCSGAGTSTGVTLVEIYDMGGATTPRFVNVSVRTQVGTGGNIQIAGFFTPGNGPKTLLIRAIGPSLSQFGVSGVMAKPMLELHTLVNGKDAVIASNAGWGGSQALSDAFTKVGAFPLQPNSTDAALLLLLHPGLMTVQVSGADGGTGVALVEIYEVP